MHQEALSYAIKLIRDCGEMLRENVHHHVDMKEGCYDLVSDMDRYVETYLVTKLTERYPNHTLLCEEGVKQLSEDTWIIDPIDGTTNFIHKHQDFAISIAYYHQYQPVFGLVYDVMNNQLYTGIHGKGAFLNDKPLACVQEPLLSEAIVDVSMHTMHTIWKRTGKQLFELQGKIRGHHSLGCASLCIAHICDHTLDAYISTNVKCWDYAAASILLQEAGGYQIYHGTFFSTQAISAVFSNSQMVLHTLSSYCK